MKILSLNIGVPAEMDWNGKSIRSSMHKHPVPGPLVVHKDHIEGNTFANPAAHGTLDFLLYAYGMPSALSFVKRLGRETYPPGTSGETLTLEDFDEQKVSVGDVFRFGEVLAQANFPRIPCGKVNFRLQHPEGQRAMQECGRSGVYLRVLKPGKIALGERAELVEKAEVNFSIFELYQLVLRKESPTEEQWQRIQANGAFPQKFVSQWGA